MTQERSQRSSPIKTARTERPAEKCRDNGESETAAGAARSRTVERTNFSVIAPSCSFTIVFCDSARANAELSSTSLRCTVGEADERTERTQHC